MEIEKMTFVERALLANQIKILSIIDLSNTQKHLLNLEIIENGYEGFYNDVFQNISSVEIPKEIYRETHEILTMCKVVKSSIKNLSPTEAATLDLKSINFNGFDASNDEHFRIATFMIEKQGLYSEFSKIELNSYTRASVIRYKKMLPVFNDINNNGLNDFGVDELRKLIDAVNS